MLGLGIGNQAIGIGSNLAHPCVARQRVDMTEKSVRLQDVLELPLYYKFAEWLDAQLLLSVPSPSSFISGVIANTGPPFSFS